jgi:hypothetical protein
MKRIYGKILDGEQVLFDKLEIWVQPAGADAWHGDFALQPDQFIACKTFRLIAEDGREGEIAIGKISPSPHGDTLVTFRGRGAFAEP